MVHRAVIGALYGDEGKGMTVDALASQAMREHGSCTVVRSNGGAQAAHTVELPDGRRHVFHHIGSGTFTGAKTHLSRFMIINPIMFNREYDDLIAMGFTPDVTVSPFAYVTFPQDMLINQMLEMLRGGSRHGSCGLGIGETMERVEKPEYYAKYRLGDLSNTHGDLSTCRTKLRNDLDTRLAALDLTYEDLPIELRSFLYDDDVWGNFVSEVTKMMTRIKFRDDAEVDSTNPVIFEAAQGLALDRDMGFFPYVTRSKTGLFNIALLCRDMGITEIEAVYVMRAYTSRHGAGPLDGEMSGLDIGVNIDDPTNIPNDWQGTLRFAPLDLWLAERLVTLDFAGAKTTDLRVWRGVALTCLDQLEDRIRIFDVDRTHDYVKRDDLWELVLRRLGADILWTSSGPSRETFQQVF